VGDLDAGVGDELLEPGRDPVDRLDLVVDVEDLPVAQQLAADGERDLGLVVLLDDGEHRLAVLGRGLDHRQRPQARHRHLEGARDRGRGHRQHVHRGAQLLEPFLLGDAEALLLVDDDEPEVLPLHALGEQRVGADHDVDGARGEPVEDPTSVLVGDEPGQRLDLDGEAGEALLEGLEVLLREDRGGHQHGDLLAVEHRLAGRADRDLGLAEPDVTGEQPVHRQRRLHVALDLVGDGELVVGLDVREGVLELGLHRPVGGERVPRRVHPGRVEPDEVGGDVADRLADAVLGPLPLRATERHDGGRLATLVAGDRVDLVGGDVEGVAVGVLEQHVVALRGRPHPDRGTRG
jgi:hypothetical protein